MSGFPRVPRYPGSGLSVNYPALVRHGRRTRNSREKCRILTRANFLVLGYLNRRER